MNPQNDVTVVCPVSFSRAESGRKRIKASPEEPLPESASIPRVAKLMALAIRFEKLVTEGLIESYADLARLGGVSFARMSQIMNLLNLAPDIQEELLFLKRTSGGSKPLTEYEIRFMAADIEWTEQRRRWEQLRPISSTANLGGGFE